DIGAPDRSQLGIKFTEVIIKGIFHTGLKGIGADKIGIRQGSGSLTKEVIESIGKPDTCYPEMRRSKIGAVSPLPGLRIENGEKAWRGGLLIGIIGYIISIVAVFLFG